jgi:predicted DNA-binding transcriptional regulator AlpA
MSKRIVRNKGAREMLGVGNSIFYENYIYRGADECIPGTDVPRLKPVALGERAVGYFVDEIEAVIAGLRRWRDANPPKLRAPIRRQESVAAYEL